VLVLRWNASLVVLAVVAWWPVDALAAAKRPPPLADQDGCEHYRGTSSGNDPSVRLDVLICPHEDGTPNKIAGQLQWSSTLSGWNLRSIEGTRSGGDLKLRDLEITEQRPESGFRFCTIDVYSLKRAADGKLAGTYDSEDCSDHATLELTPLEPVPPSKPKEPKRPQERKADAKTPDKPESNEPPATKPEPDSTSGCSCGVAPLFMLPLFGLGRPRRRGDALN